jgi:hypothetical protein
MPERSRSKSNLLAAGAIVGQFYIAILVASLVGVSIAGAQPRD